MSRPLVQADSYVCGGLRARGVLQYCNIAILQHVTQSSSAANTNTTCMMHATEGTARTHRHHAHLAVFVAIWLVASACGCCFLEVASSILQQAPLPGLNCTCMAALAGASGRPSRRPHWLSATIEATAAAAAYGSVFGDAGPASDSSCGAACADFDWSFVCALTWQR